ncbi:unnamed protein product, partial [Heterobilharzia americana]
MKRVNLDGYSAILGLMVILMKIMRTERSYFLFTILITVTENALRYSTFYLYVLLSELNTSGYILRGTRGSRIRGQN